ncbi:pantoate--beta-alanine ligase [Metabacillus sp. GX 13764]|uniref:pantoate--beta-alanine ligase n=1 Tax=Metabacillus kandeliae TaxID=2900151 RepID=UPI001E3ACEE4|nr:pantoate--beta-alanine ligase [Metabacillus kandeliae]MCD7033394.1 pantoate--beta-alanine ligase [Metabacillus kandeliae]
MIKAEKIAELTAAIRKWKEEGKSIGFVPTMGFLHEGHLSLIKKAKSENDAVVVSIFVNPLQFGPNEDFEAYPRSMERDLAVSEDAGADLVFAPDAGEMYKGKPAAAITVTNRVDVLCGKSRPGHFDGVAAVLTKLFHLTQPDRAYFGMKDAQQVAVVKGLVDEFYFPLEIVPVETVRESDGLAKSSRNVYLTEQERAEAPHLQKALQKAAEMAEAGEWDAAKLENQIKDYLNTHTTAEIDYAEVLSYPELAPPAEESKEIILAAAIKFSKARLIDNITLKLKL